MQEGYKVVTLCGSTRFRDEFYAAQKMLTLEKNIVLSVGLFGREDDEDVWEGLDGSETEALVEMLDDMHKRKIDMADAIFVVNKDGYVGDSTRSEIEYAREHGKDIMWLEPEHAI